MTRPPTIAEQVIAAAAALGGQAERRAMLFAPPMPVTGDGWAIERIFLGEERIDAIRLNGMQDFAGGEIDLRTSRVGFWFSDFSWHTFTPAYEYCPQDEYDQPFKWARRALTLLAEAAQTEAFPWAFDPEIRKLIKSCADAVIPKRLAQEELAPQQQTQSAAALSLI